MSGYILAIDQGTTSSRSLLFNEDGDLVTVAQQPFNQHFPQPGWVEHDPEEIWSSQLNTILQVIQKARIKPTDIKAIGITNQRETTVVWNRKTGLPIANAIVWQDRRTAGHCDQLKKEGYSEVIQSKTGLVIDAYFSGTKIKWLLDHHAQGMDLADLACGTIDSWLIWKLTGGRIHYTDVSNASRTMLYNIHTHGWGEILLELLKVPAEILPTLGPSSGICGMTDKSIFGAEVPIAGVAGDQQAALFGQRCVIPGMVKNTYGTGCFMLMYTGDHAVQSSQGLLTTMAWGLDGQYHYALEGSVFVGGAAVQWLRDGLGIISNSQDVETLANSVPDSGGVMMVPAFTGLGAPYWDQYARGTLLGLTRGSTKAHIARATLEAIAYQCQDLVQSMQHDSHYPFQEMRVDGGATTNNLLMQFQADISHCRVSRPTVQESTALGAAMFAGLGAGFWKKENLDDLWKADRFFQPTMAEHERKSRLHHWHRAVERAKAWEE